MSTTKLPPLEYNADTEEDAVETAETADETVWAPPTVGPGSVVMYWPDGNTKQIPTPMIVTSVNTSGDKSVTGTRVIRGQVYLFDVDSSVPHKDDPRLIDSPSLARGGVWDITPERRELEHRLAQLEAVVGKG